MKSVLHRRRIISFICIMSVMFGLLVHPIAAGAAKTFGPYTFLQSKNLIMLSGYDAAKDPTGEVCIEKVYSESGTEYLVEGIKNTAFKGKSLASLTVKTTVVREEDRYLIDNEAFLETEIGLTSSDPKAIFQGGEITAIGARAFQDAKIGCDLIFQNVNGEISSQAFKNINVAGVLKIYGSIKRLGERAFEGARMQTLALTKDIYEIEAGAFKDTLVKEWIVPENLKKLGSNIFEGCVLTKITLPSTDMEREIAEDAFPDQEGLTIVIPKGLTDLSVFHFENYKNLTFQTDASLTEDSPVVSWLKENSLTYKVGENGELVKPKPDDISEPTPTPTEEPTPEPTLEPTEEPTPEPTLEPTEEPTSVSTKKPIQTSEPTGTAVSSTDLVLDQKPVPELETIKENSVHTVKNVQYKIKDNNNAVVTGTGKKNLKKLKIPGTVKISGRLYKVTSIQKKAFKGKKKLETVSIGNYVTDVGNEAFAECPKLKQIQFGTGLKQLGKKVLYKDRKLKKIMFKGKKLKKIGRKTFYGVPRHVDIRAVRSKVKYYARLINRSKK